MSVTSAPLYKLLGDRTMATSAALYIFQQIAEQILLSKGQGKPRTKSDLHIFLTIPIVRGCITDWSQTVSPLDEIGGCSNDYLRPFIELALKMLPGPYEKHFLIKATRAAIESIDGNLHAIVLGLNEATEQARLFERCMKSFDDGLDCQDNKRYTDAITKYQSAMELCPSALIPSRAAICAKRSECFLREQLWADASAEGRKAIDILNSMGEHFSAQEKAMTQTEKVRECSWSVRIQALYRLSNLKMATEDYIAALSSDIQLDISPASLNVLESSGFLEFIWSCSTVSDTVSFVKQELSRLVASTTDDSQTFLPGDVGTIVLFLSRLEKNPNGELDWSRNGAPGFWSMSQALIFLLSLATIPQYRSYCPFTKAQLRDILYVQPQKAFGVALNLKTKISIQQIANSMIKIAEKSETSLRQTAQDHLDNSTWGKNMALIYQIAFQVVRDQSVIRRLDNAALLSSILVDSAGAIDYSRVRVVGSEPGMTRQDTRDCVRQLMKTELRVPKTYMDALSSHDTFTWKKSMETRERRSVFELMLCSFALLYSQSSFLEDDVKEDTKSFHLLLPLLSAPGSSTFLNPDISALVERLTSLRIGSTVGDEISSLVAAIVVLIFKEDAQEY